MLSIKDRIGTVNAGHKIIQASEINGSGFAIGSMETRYGHQYAVWQYIPERGEDYFWGHYFYDSPHVIGDPLYKDPLSEALRDYYRRIQEELNFLISNI